MKIFNPSPGTYVTINELPVIFSAIQLCIFKIITISFVFQRVTEIIEHIVFVLFPYYLKLDKSRMEINKM